MTTAVPEDATTPVIREAVRADLLTIFRIERAAFPQPWPFAAFERFLDEPAFLVAESVSGPCPERSGTDDHCVVGYVVADTIPNHDHLLGHVKDFAVAENRREEGIGRRLLERSLSVLAANGADAVKLEVRESNDVAREMYESFGFSHRRTVPRYYSNGEDALVLVKDLER
ncbi:GNAT family N-acetyltransferase [Haloarculaceae archaeon H-GB11]|nr:GNAT family N-acetyltransferase [Haloarculaceae archaeon H-GB11]